MHKVKEEILEKIIEGLGKGYSWNSYLPNQAAPFTHQNIVTEKAYRGVNQLLLTFQAFEKGYRSNKWGTYKAFKNKGYQINKGEKSTRCLFYKFIVKENKETLEEETRVIISYFNLFNLSQTDAEIPEEEKTEHSESFDYLGLIQVKQPDMVIEYNDYATPQYNVTQDKIVMPSRDIYENINNFYGSAFHEVGHWSGAEKRLNRFKDHDDKESYSKEELVAEIFSAMTLSHFGLNSEERLENSTAYLEGWINAIGENPSILFEAASKSQKAFDFIFDNQNTGTNRKL